MTSNIPLPANFIQSLNLFPKVQPEENKYSSFIAFIYKDAY